MGLSLTQRLQGLADALALEELEPQAQQVSEIATLVFRLNEKRNEALMERGFDWMTEKVPPLGDFIP